MSSGWSLNQLPAPIGKSLVFLGNSKKELLHLLEFFGMLLGKIVSLRKIITQIIQLPLIGVRIPLTYRIRPAPRSKA